MTPTDQHDEDEDKNEDTDGADTVDPRRPGATEREQMDEGDEEAAERYADSPGAGLAGALDDLPEPNEPG